jgi:hypothetical protein
MLGKHYKSYWKWDESYNTSPLKLGMSIQDIPTNIDFKISEFGIDDDKNYDVNDETLVGFHTYKGQIYMIAYRGEINFFQPTLWDNEDAIFIEEMNKHLLPIVPYPNEDFLYVHFIDGFIRMAMIIRGAILNTKKEQAK